VVRLVLALCAGGALALVVGWNGSEAATTTTTTTTPSTETVTSTQTVTSTTTTTATSPTQTTTVTETKTAPGPTTSISNQTTTVTTAPAPQPANNSSGDVPTWAWVVMGVMALAIVGLIALVVRERDLRTIAERRISDQGPSRAGPGYGSQESGYGRQGSEYDTQRFEPRDQPPGGGGQGSGPNRPAS
jgi:hypothetical protein